MKKHILLKISSVANYTFIFCKKIILKIKESINSMFHDSFDNNLLNCLTRNISTLKEINTILSIVFSPLTLNCFAHLEEHIFPVHGIF